MNESIQLAGPSASETLNGGLDLLLTLADGRRESVRVLQVPLRVMDKLLAAQGDEVALALIYTGRDEAWFNSLSPESQEAVVMEGDRVNADFFGRWFARRLDRQEKLLPGSREKLFGALLAPAAALAAEPGPLPNLPRPRVMPAG